MRNILLGTLLFVVPWIGGLQTGFAQNPADTLIAGNVRYILHEVQKKQTLYSISKAYGVPMDSIISFHGDEAKALKAGMMLKIPVGRLKKANYILHKVEAKETLYGLSQRYGVSQQSIEALNPSLAEGLKVGMEIKIPSLETSANNAKMEESSLFSADRKMSPCKLNPIAPTTLHEIAVFLPFFGSQGEWNGKSKIAIDFFNGLKMAFDSLERNGFNGIVHVYDTENDTAKLRRLLQNPEMKAMDLFIGPLYSSAFMVASRFALKHKIPIISPFAQSPLILENNKWVLKMMPDGQIQASSLVKRLKMLYPGAQVIMVKPGPSNDKELYGHFSKAFLHYDMLPIYEVEYTGIGSVAEKLASQKKNIIVFLSNSQAQVVDFTGKLAPLASQKEIILVGPSDWNSFDNINFEQLSQLKFTYVTNTFTAFDKPAYRLFSNRYYDAFGYFPSVYANQGYDAGLYFGNLLQRYGKEFCDCIEQEQKYVGFNNNFQFLQVKSGSGFDNRKTNLIQVQDLQAISIDE